MSTEQPIPDSPFYRRLAAGHRIRLGHDLAGSLITGDNGISALRRTCCPPDSIRTGMFVRRKSDGRLGFVRNAWTQTDGTEGVFVESTEQPEFLSDGMLGEPASAYEEVHGFRGYAVTLDCRSIPDQEAHIRALPRVTLDAAQGMRDQRWIAGHFSLGRVVRVIDLAEIPPEY